MFQGLSTFKTSMAMARHAGMKQAITSQNIANADTPGYRARVLQDFKDIGKTRKGDFALRTPHLKHFDAKGISIRATMINQKGVEKNGNGVTLETEIINSVSARRQHDRALTIYRTSLGILRSTLSKQ